MLLDDTLCKANSCTFVVLIYGLTKSKHLCELFTSSYGRVIRVWFDNFAFERRPQLMWFSSKVDRNEKLTAYYVASTAYNKFIAEIMVIFHRK